MSITIPTTQITAEKMVCTLFYNYESKIPTMVSKSPQMAKHCILQQRCVMFCTQC